MLSNQLFEQTSGFAKTVLQGPLGIGRNGRSGDADPHVGLTQVIGVIWHTWTGPDQSFKKLDGEFDAAFCFPAVSLAYSRSFQVTKGEEMLVFPVESVAALEDEGHGVFMERRGAAAGCGHQLFLLEARFSKLALTAEVMLAAARALPGCKARAYGLFDLPLGRLWGELRDRAEKEWI